MNYNCTKLYFLILYTYIIVKYQNLETASIVLLSNELNTNQN